MARSTVVPDRKLLAAHAKRVKPHGIDAFIEECIEKNLGFRPELRAYDFAATPELLASAVIVFLDASRTHDSVGYVLAGIHKKLGKLDLALTADDVRLMCEIALAQDTHYAFYLSVILPYLEKLVKAKGADAKLAKRVAELADRYAIMRTKRDDPKLAARLKAVRAKLA